MLFNELNCSEEILRALEDMGFEEATPIQTLAIPVALSGADIVGQAQTGTGKTAAFTIPMLEKIDTKSRTVQSLVLCPTRELAVQIAEEVQKIGKYKKGLHILPVFGGQDFDRQIRGLKAGCQIIIGTPGRVLDHIRRKTLKLNNLQMLILDEADEMLNMGFREDIESVLDEVSHDIQTMLFSATMPREILAIIDKYQNDPQMVKVEHKALSAPNIEQVYLEMKDKDKIEILSRLVDLNGYKLSIVFCNTKKRVDEVSDMLIARGYAVDKIHGDMRQQQRLSVIGKFKRGDIELLIATDVAARGLDIDGVEAVFNYDLPTHEEYYVHRIGRTGRAGKEGVSYTFVTFKEHYLLKSLQKYIKTEIKHMEIPKYGEIAAIKREKFSGVIKSLVEKGVDNVYFEMIESLAEEGFSPSSIAAALIQAELHNDEQFEIDSIDNNNSYGRAKEERSRSRDRGRDGRDSRDGRKNRGFEKGMTRLHLNLGRDCGIMPRDIVGSIAGETGMDGKLIGGIDIFDNYTSVDVPNEYADRIIERMNRRKIKGRQVILERLSTIKPIGSKSSSSKNFGKRRERSRG